MKVIEGDHPRVCGEKLCVGVIAVRTTGSPPRMRGKASGGVSVQPFAGITPAYAGKSPFVLSLSPARRDHPRVCGEKSFFAMEPFTAYGSPPRMRGKAAALCELALDVGITPAYAGKRRSIPSLSLSPEDHPRVCGEK